MAGLGNIAYNPVEWELFLQYCQMKNDTFEFLILKPWSFSIKSQFIVLFSMFKMGQVKFLWNVRWDESDKKTKLDLGDKGEALLTPLPLTECLLRTPSRHGGGTGGSQQKLPANFTFSSKRKLKLDAYNYERQSSQLFIPDQFRCFCSSPEGRLT